MSTSAAPADLAYATAANDAAGLPLSLSIYADRAHVRGLLRDDAVAAGFRIAEEAGIATLLDGEPRPLGDVVLLDCPTVDGATLAALARLDLRAAHSGAQLVVSTSVAALEDVFACLDQSAPQILVEPNRAERVIALGRVLAQAPRLRLRELVEGDRMVLLRLTEQVDRIAERLDRIAAGSPAGSSGRIAEGDLLCLESPAPDFSGPTDEPGAGDRLARASRPPLPDPRLVRRIIRQRQLRARFFAAELFADPAWDILLDLTAARAEHVRVSVTSLCIASGVPPTTALRWIAQMTEAGLLARVEDETDRRRVFIVLTDKAADAMAQYFAGLGRGAGRLA